jgi:hypothetical protein
VAKACKVWDVDDLENKMPVCLLAEWNEYLNYELSIYARAILGAIPAAGALSSSGAASGTDGVIRLTDPDQVAGFFDSIARGAN